MLVKRCRLPNQYFLKMELLEFENPSLFRQTRPKACGIRHSACKTRSRMRFHTSFCSLSVCLTSDTQPAKRGLLACVPYFRRQSLPKTCVCRNANLCNASVYYSRRYTHADTLSHIRQVLRSREALESHAMFVPLRLQHTLRLLRKVPVAASLLDTFIYTYISISISICCIDVCVCGDTSITPPLHTHAEGIG